MKIILTDAQEWILCGWDNAMSHTDESVPISIFESDRPTICNSRIYNNVLWISRATAIHRRSWLHLDPHTPDATIAQKLDEAFYRRLQVRINSISRTNEIEPIPILQRLCGEFAKAS